MTSTAVSRLVVVFLIPLLIAPAACEEDLRGRLESGREGGPEARAEPQERRPNRDDRPNVVLITMDTTRADRLSLYGGRAEVSPVLGKLARDGVVFDRAISTSGITAPAHASILTGLYPHNHGLRIFAGDKGMRIDATRASLPRVLESHGWRTAAFVSAYPVSAKYGFDGLFQMFDSGTSPAVAGGERVKLNPKRSWQHQQSLPSQRRADATTRLAIEWLRRVEAPFFLWLHYFDPHDPRLVPPKEFLAQFDLSTPPPPGRAGNRLAYEPEISFMDQQIGVVLNHLSSRGVYENTLVVALADHGQGLGDHGWFYHRLLYQEQIHIPLIVKLPKSVAPMPKRLDAIVRSVDVFPTVLDVLGLPISTELDGRSLMPLIRGRADSPRSGLAEALNTLDTAVPPGLPDKHRDLLFALVEDRWKAIYHAGSPNASELYDLRVDPQELANVASKHPDVLQSMIAQIESTGATSMAFSKSDEVDAEHIEQLKALGYVEE